MKVTSHKEVNYRGLTLLVPHHATHIGMDGDMGLSWFEGKPVEGGWAWVGFYSCGYICDVETDSEWPSTLEEIK